MRHRSTLTYLLTYLLTYIKRFPYPYTQFTRDAMHSTDYVAARCLSVCLSVCHTPVFCRNGLSPSSRHTILHFALPNIMAVFRRGPPDVECTVGMKKLRFSTNISLYPRNDTKYGHSYYRMRIENCTQTFKWYHFQ